VFESGQLRWANIMTGLAAQCGNRVPRAAEGKYIRKRSYHNGEDG
jgi:hypothetical protein